MRSKLLLERKQARLGSRSRGGRLRVYGLGFRTVSCLGLKDANPAKPQEIVSVKPAILKHVFSKTRECCTITFMEPMIMILSLLGTSTASSAVVVWADTDWGNLAFSYHPTYL